MNLDYWDKNPKPSDDILWNIPEQKTGTIQLIGGNSQNFSNIIRNAEYLNSLPLRDVKVLLPEALRSKLPPLPNIDFAPATDSGSFAKSTILNNAAIDADFIFCAGEFSKNSATAIALAEALRPTTRPILLTRDTVDLLATEMSNLIIKNHLFLFASLAQLQKVFRALYYPKMLLLSMPLVPVIETLHKFTLSYPATVITFHQNQIIIAKDGAVTTTPIENTTYSPLSLWSGQLASNIATFNLWNPTQTLATTVTALQKSPVSN